MTDWKALESLVNTATHTHLSEAFTYTPPGGAPEEAVGIFTSVYDDVEPMPGDRGSAVGSSVRVGTIVPVLAVLAGALTTDPERGGTVELRGVTYRVAGAPVPVHGEIHLTLQRTS